MPKVCEYGKTVKKRLVDIDKNQEWLIEEVKNDTGLFFDSSYMYKILTGKLASPKIISSISKILNIK